jgi:hypothetical protein
MARSSRSHTTLTALCFACAAAAWAASAAPSPRPGGGGGHGGDIPCQIPVVAPGVTLEEDGPCAEKVGTDFHDASGHDGHSYWTAANEVAPDYADGMFWKLQFPEAGTWRVRAWIPADATDLIGKTQYKIQYQGQSKMVEVDQSAHAGTWIDLGTYAFGQGGEQWVRLGDYYTDGAQQGKHVVFDAIEIAQPGAGGADGGGTDGGSVEAGGSGGASPSDGGTAPEAGHTQAQPSATDDAGCGCKLARTEGRRSGAGGWAAASFTALAWLAARRR